jgi:hypothetical protein
LEGKHDCVGIYYSGGRVEFQWSLKDGMVC